MSRDPIADAVYELGVETGWEVDVVKSQGRLLIIRAGVAVGEILGDGTRVDFPDSQRFTFEGEEDPDAW